MSASRLPACGHSSPDELVSFVQEVEAGPVLEREILGQRLTFESSDPMIALTYVAAVTRRIRLMTSVLCLPFHKEGVVAQQAATLDRLSGGRFSFGFGIGLGGRQSDVRRRPGSLEAHRGERFEAQVLAMKRIWAGEATLRGTEPVGPHPADAGQGPELIIGGFAPVALRRAGRIADGVRSFDFSTNVEEHLARYALVMEGWQEAGRSGRPRLVTATNFALGPDAQATYEAHVAKYYGYDKDLMAWALSGEAPTTPEAVTAAIRRASPTPGSTS